MSIISRVRSTARNLFQNQRQECELDEEVRAHVDLLIEEKLAHGMSADDARRSSLLEVEGIEVVKERVRDVRAGNAIEQLLQDLRFGVRILRKSPGFASVVVTTLALGIGVNTAMFSIIDAVLLRPLPYKDPERLVTGPVSLPDYRDITQSATSFGQIGVYATNMYTLRTGDRAEQVRGVVASKELLDMLGSPLLGRLPQTSESRQPLVVLSYDFWNQRFGGRTDAIGATLNIGQPYTVIGVMPRDFPFPSAEYRFWVTMDSAMASTPEQLEDRALRIFKAVARLKPGVTVAQAQAELDGITARLQREHPDTNAQVRIQFTPLYEITVGSVRRAMLILLGTVGLVLLIAAANVSNLLLARNAARERELALRACLGASRIRLSQQLVTESLLLSGVGGGLGLAVASVGISAVQRIVPPGTVPRLESVQLDTRVMIVTAAVSIFTGLLVGVLPAFTAVRGQLFERIKSGGAGSGASRGGTRVRRVLVVLEIALALVVCCGAGLLLRSLNRLLNTNTGLVSENLLTGLIGLPELATEKRSFTVEEILDRIRQLPGVRVAGAATGLPPVTPQRAARFEASGVPTTENLSAYYLAATPDYFAALKTHFLAGRPFDARDHQHAPLVVIINQEAAKELYPNRSAIGEQIKIINPGQGTDWRRIVGVVQNVKYTGLSDDAAPTIYTPYAQNPALLAGVYLMIRTDSTPLALTRDIERAVSAAAPALAVVNLQTMDEIIHGSTAQPRFQSLLLSGFAILALALASVGVYGLMAFAVTQRTREMGIRVSLGARPGQVAGLMLRSGFKLVMIGATAGILAGLCATRVLRSLLYGVQSYDAVTFVTAAGVLMSCALLACYIPARRAAWVDPSVALRQE